MLQGKKPAASFHLANFPPSSPSSAGGISNGHAASTLPPPVAPGAPRRRRGGKSPVSTRCADAVGGAPVDVPPHFECGAPKNFMLARPYKAISHFWRPCEAIQYFTLAPLRGAISHFGASEGPYTIMERSPVFSHRDTYFDRCHTIPPRVIRH